MDNNNDPPPPYSSIANDLPPPYVPNDNDPPPEEICNDPPPEDICNDPPPEDIYVDLPPEDIRNDLPPEDIRNNLPPAEDVPIQEPIQRSETRRAIVHEVTLALGGALLLKFAWAIAKYFKNDPPSFVQLVFTVMTLKLMCDLDNKEYHPPFPYPSYYVLAIRACTNFVLFILGLQDLLVTKFRGSIFDDKLKSWHVPEPVVSFVKSWIGFVSLIGILRTLILVVLIILKKRNVNRRVRNNYDNDDNDNDDNDD